jgi:tetratricopeptide (TPR) repeat protein
MSIRFVLIYLLFSFISGCAGLYGTQPPAPVYGGKSIEKSRNVPAPKRQAKVRQEPAETVTTEPLREPDISQPESIEFQPETLPPETEDSLPAENDQEGQLSPTPLPAQPLTFQEPEPAAEPLTPFEPLEISDSLSPAVGALVLAANQNTSSGNLEAASATIERAIRIEPRNANLFYKLALIRLKQSKPRLAEDLAKKSALLAANDITLKRHSWLLIAHARELQKNFKGAKEARAKADRL